MILIKKLIYVIKETQFWCFAILCLPFYKKMFAIFECHKNYSSINQLPKFCIDLKYRGQRLSDNAIGLGYKIDQHPLHFIFVW